LAAHAASKATESIMCTLSTDVLRLVVMAHKTSGDSTLGVSGIIFRRIQDSFTTQGLLPKFARIDAQASLARERPVLGPD
jgi:hypothetical protein